MKEIELCDKVSKRFQDLFDAANISYTTYIRTTEPRHAVAVKEIWDQLLARGYIYKGHHEGWYSVSDEAFYPSTHVEEKISEKTGEKYHVSPADLLLEAYPGLPVFILTELFAYLIDFD
jgi:methionyl-tRNA synthetase